jgi:tetratricopeptide (TPR) repeat protein
MARYDFDWSGAEKELRRAIELNHNYAAAHHWYALHLTFVGQFEKALAEIAIARDLDPLSLIVNTNVGWILYFARQYEEAKSQLAAVLEMDANFLSAHIKLGWIYEQQGFYEQAIVEFQKASSLANEDVNVLALLCDTYALSGKRKIALLHIDELVAQSKTRYISPHWFARIYANLNEKDKAFAWLEEAYIDRSGGLVWLKVDPKLDKLRSDLRFNELLIRVGLN